MSARTGEQFLRGLADGREIWVGGDGGLALGDGRKFRPVATMEGKVTAISGRGAGEVWVGGERGLHRGVRRR